jgi:hypothetical protein
MLSPTARCTQGSEGQGADTSRTAAHVHHTPNTSAGISHSEGTGLES